VRARPGRQFSTRWQLNFAAYAVSAVTGQETAVTFPVLVGVPPAKNPVATPTPIPTAETVTNTCSAHM
jgi:hypothetical protein